VDLLEVDCDDYNYIYTYTIFDCNPSQGGDCSWPSHIDVEVEADNPADALEQALEEAKLEGESRGGYSAGDRLWVLVWDKNEQVVADGSVELEIDEY
jgi:hypothetical protein